MPEVSTKSIAKRRQAGVTDPFGDLLHLQASLRQQLSMQESDILGQGFIELNESRQLF